MLRRGKPIPPLRKVVLGAVLNAVSITACLGLGYWSVLQVTAYWR